jgi:hypothetical protein
MSVAHHRQNPIESILSGMYGRIFIKFYIENSYNLLIKCSININYSLNGMKIHTEALAITVVNLISASQE